MCQIFGEEKMTRIDMKLGTNFTWIGFRVMNFNPRKYSRLWRFLLIEQGREKWFTSNVALISSNLHIKPHVLALFIFRKKINPKVCVFHTKKTLLIISV